MNLSTGLNFAHLTLIFYLMCEPEVVRIIITLTLRKMKVLKQISVEIDWMWNAVYSLSNRVHCITVNESMYILATDAIIAWNTVLTDIVHDNLININ